MSGWDGLIQIFHPEHQHLVDEMDSKRIVADIPGSEGDPNRDYVDLDRGIVHFALPPERYGSVWSGRPDDEQA